MAASYRQLLDADDVNKQTNQSIRFAEDEDDSNFEDKLDARDQVRAADPEE